MQKPRYQDYQADSIQTIDDKDAKVRVISGNYKGISGPVVIQNPSMLLDVTVKPGGTFTQQVKPFSSTLVESTHWVYRL